MTPSEAGRGMIIAVLSSFAMGPLLLAAGKGVSSGASQASATPDAKPPDTFDVAAIDTYVAAEAKAKGYVGLSLAIVKDGTLVLAKGYGLASREAHAPVEVATAFGIGSVSKQFTCAAAFLAEEDGKLSMNDKVSKYFPDLARADEITLADLGGHVSGYPDYYPLDFLDERMQKDILPDALLHRYATGKLDFDPRTRWSYSNTGFVLLARAVEKATGRGLGETLKEKVFDPIAMTHASYEPAAGTPGLAQGYEAYALGEPFPAPREASGWLGGAGGIFASAEDLAKWDIAFMGGKVLTPESFARMTTPRVLESGHKTGYGCGLDVYEQAGETVLAHSGEVNGFLAANAMIPRLHGAVAVLSNDQGKDPRAFARLVVRLLLKSTDRPVPKVAGPPALEVARSLFHEMQLGKVDRSRLGPDFDAYAKEDRVESAGKRLSALGEPQAFDLELTTERGGMEVSVVHITFKTAKLRALMFRSTDGKVQEFLLEKES